jgi:hypothetical protein
MSRRTGASSDVEISRIWPPRAHGLAGRRRHPPLRQHLLRRPVGMHPGSKAQRRQPHPGLPPKQVSSWNLQHAPCGRFPMAPASGVDTSHASLAPRSNRMDSEPGASRKRCKITNKNRSNSVTTIAKIVITPLCGQLGSSGKSGAPKTTSREVPSNELLNVTRFDRSASRLVIKLKMGVADHLHWSRFFRISRLSALMKSKHLWRKNCSGPRIEATAEILAC